jgi:predicted GIY-YIG superfamily endonuclease
VAENDQDRIRVKGVDGQGKIQHKALSYLALYPSRGIQKSLVMKQHHKRCSKAVELENLLKIGLWRKTKEQIRTNFLIKAIQAIYYVILLWF